MKWSWYMWWAKRDLFAARAWDWVARICLARSVACRVACQHNLDEARAINVRRCLGGRESADED